MQALVRDEVHTFVTYDQQGDRTVYRIGPFYRYERTGAIHWEWLTPCKRQRVDYQASYADGIPQWDVTTRLPDGTSWDARRDTPPAPRTLRAMVVEAARQRGELSLLDAAVPGGCATWVAAGSAQAESRRRV